MSQQSAIANMSRREFEQFIARLFAALGYVNIQLTPGTGDEGKDIEMELPVPLGGTMRFLAECKHWQRSSVGRPVVQKLHSAVLTDPTVDGGIIVTSGRFTSGAVEYAERTGIKLIDGDALYRLARSKGIDFDGSAAFAYDAEAYFDRGNAHQNQGDYEQAIADYTRAIEINPNHAEAYRKRSDAYAALGDYQQASADWTKAVEIRQSFAREMRTRTKEALKKQKRRRLQRSDDADVSSNRGDWLKKWKGKRSRLQKSDDADASSNR